MAGRARRVASGPGRERRRKAEPDFEVANRLFFRLYQASNLMHKTGTRSVAAFGSTTQQWAVLGALSRPAVLRHGMTVKELIAFLLTSRQNLTAVLNRLERMGFVERVRVAHDGRVRRLRLTRQGARTWNRMLINIRAYYERALDGFSAAERRTLVGLLDRLKSRLASL